jgi:hypothetical protein
MTRKFAMLMHGCVAGLFLAGLLGIAPYAKAQTQLQVYGAWHCYTDGCSWASAPNMTTFDTDNRWMIDRNMNGTYQPSVNLVVLSFVEPVKLMNLTTDSGDVNGIPIGMNTAVINYFQSRGVRVMMSIGGGQLQKRLGQGPVHQSDTTGHQRSQRRQAIQCRDGD